MAGFLAIRHGAGELAVFNFTISANTANWNVIAQIGHTPGVPVTVNVTVNSGILVRDLVAGSPTQAMDFSGLPSGSTINLVNLGYIQGQGGAGGAGGSFAGANAGAGGAAIKGPGSGRTLNVTNASGNIWGGGGGGGGGGGCALWNAVDVAYEPHGGGGGGGGGAGGSSGGAGGNGAAGDGAAGAAGTSGISGARGLGGGGFDSSTGDGGNGGDWGAAGAAGSSGSKHGGGPGGTHGIGGSSGAGGRAVNLNGGTINWISGSGSPNVKGSVGG